MRAANDSAIRNTQERRDCALRTADARVFGRSKVSESEIMRIRWACNVVR